jgi:hypothetical protein
MEKTEGDNSDGVKKNEGKDRKTELATCDGDSDGDSDSSGPVVKILATLTLTKDKNGNWGVVQQQPATSSTTLTQGAASMQDEMTTGGWSSTDEDEWVFDRSTEVPVNHKKLKAKHMGRQLKNKKLKKPDV